MTKRGTKTPTSNDVYTVINIEAVNRTWFASEKDAIAHAETMIDTHNIDGVLVVVKGLKKVTRRPATRIESM